MADLTKKFIGKKLLLLGTNVATCDIANYAKSQGAYIIVTDKQPIEKSAATLYHNLSSRKQQNYGFHQNKIVLP